MGSAPWPWRSCITSGANTTLGTKARNARQQTVGALNILHANHVPLDHHDGLTNVEGTERAQYVSPFGDIGGRALIWRLSGEASLRHQQFRCDVLDSQHPETILLEEPANTRQQMIVTAAESSPYASERAKRGPVETDLR